jgi:predicted molibdopterin-dependent oxidoreductase YjgC
MRIESHPILGKLKKGKIVTIEVDGNPIKAFEGEPIAAALWAAGIKTFRTTEKRKEQRGPFCAIGLCTDCLVNVNGIPNVRACITPIEKDMDIKTTKER